MHNWRRVGDSNSCALSARQFSRLLGYHLPIPSYVKRSGAGPRIRTETVLFLRQTPPANWASPAWTTRTESNRE